MSTSFYWGNDAELYDGSQNFARQLAVDPAAYGLSAQQVADYAAVVATWRAAYDAASSPATRTILVTFAKREAKRAVRSATASLANFIAGTATVTDQQKLDLGLSVRGRSGRPGAPGTPDQFRIEFASLGAITLRWKCANPTAGTMYQIYRTIEAMPGAMTTVTTDGVAVGVEQYLGSVGVKRFTDATLPVGTSRVTYRVQAIRSTAIGASASHTVAFGVTAEDATLLAKSEGLAAKRVA